MTASSFIVEFKKRIPESDWPWATAALRQDPTIWHELQGELGILALEKFGNRTAVFTPAALSLLALGYPEPSELIQGIQDQNESFLERRWERDGQAITKLGESGLNALMLVNQWRFIGSWRDHSQQLIGTSPTAAACLYGLLSNPASLLSALLTIEEPWIAANAFLSNPAPPAMQADILIQTLQQATPDEFLPLIRALFVQRPNLAVGIAQQLLQSPQWAQSIGQPAGVPAINHLDMPFHNIKNLLFTAEIYRLAAQPNLAVPILSETVKLVRNVQAEIAAQLARVSAEDDNRQRCLSAWEQANHLNPDSLDHLGGFLLALLDNNQPDEAETRLREQPTAIDENAWQSIELLYARASLALHAGNLEDARQCAILALTGLVQMPDAEKPTNAINSKLALAVARLFQDLALPQQAIQASQAALAYYPGSSEASASLATSYLAAGQLRQAIEYAHIAVALAPDRLDFRRNLVEMLEAGQDWEAAYEEFVIIIDRKTNPTKADLYEFSASALNAGHPEKAILICQQVLQDDNQDGNALAVYAQSIAAQGNLQDAIDILVQTTQDNPSHPAAWQALARLYHDSGDFAKSLDTLRAASQAVSDDPTILLSLGEAYLLQESPTQALAPLRNAYHSLLESHIEQPNQKLLSQAAFRLGQTLDQLGHQEDARDALAVGFNAAPYNPDIALSYAQVLLALADPEPALTPLMIVMQSDPPDPQPYLDYARCILGLDGGIEDEQYQQALHYLSRAIELEPDLPEAKALKAEVMAASGDLMSAVNAYRKALDTRLAQDPAWMIRLWLGLGKVALDLGQIETAIAALQEASQVGSGNPDVQRLLCEAYDAAGLIENAYAAAQSALELAPNEIDILIWFAQKVHDLQGQPGAHLSHAHEEAVKALDQATRQATDSARWLARLGEIQLRLGETEAAYRTFRRLIGEGDDEIPAITLDATTGDLQKAALGLLELGDAPGAVACLERAVQVAKEEATKSDRSLQSKSPTRLQLLRDLAYAYHQAGMPEASLQALEQAIHLNGQLPDLYLKKATILVQLENADSSPGNHSRERIEQALDALQTALELDSTNPELHIQASLVLRKLGELSRALEHAEQAYQMQLNQADRPTDILPACLLAADIARASLQYSQAIKFLDEISQETFEGDPNLQIEFHLMRAELALESQDLNRAAQEIAQVVELCPDNPSLLALQIRIGLRKSEINSENRTDTISLTAERFILSLESFSKGNEENCEETSKDYVLPLLDSQIAAQRRLAKTALELRLWQPAMELSNQLSITASAEPDSHLNKARNLVLRAEYQHICQAVEAVANAPGGEAISEEAFREFQFALQTAEGQLLQSSQAVSPPAVDAQAAGQKDSPYPIINRWQARGAAIFCPSTQSAEALTKLPANPEDTMALIACLQEISDISSAGRVASAYANNPYVLTRLAIALADDKPRQALVAIQGAVEVLFASDETAQTQSVPDDLLLSRIDVPIILVLLAKLLHQYGSSPEDEATAIQALHRALKVWPNEPRWHILVAQVILTQKEGEDSVDHDSAIAHLKKAIQLEPDQPAAYRILGQLYEELNVYDEAIKMLDTAVQLAPQDGEAWMELAGVYHTTGDLQKATSCADEAASLSPDQVKPLILLGRIDLEEHNLQGAQEHAQAALMIEPENTDALLLAGRALKALERSEEAVVLLEKALPTAVDPLPLHLEHIELIRQTKGVKAALQAATDLTNRYPDEPKVLSLLSVTLEEDGQIQEATRAAQRALRCKSCDEILSDKEKAFLHYHLGELLGKAGHLDQSIHHLVEAININPEYVEPFLELGRVHQQRRQHSLAITAFNQAIDAAPNDARPYYHAGMALKESKDYLQAEKMLRRACELAPEDVSIHRLLGAVVALNLVHNRREPIVTGSHA